MAAGLNAMTFNGVRIHDLDHEALVEAVLAMRDCDHSHVVHFLAADPLTLASRDPSFGSVLRVADINVPDGLPLVWAIRAAGGRATRITASDGLSLLCAEGVEAGTRHYFFGSSEVAVNRLAANLAAEHRGLQIVGAYSPPFRPLENDEFKAAIARIRAADTDVLWVGLGAPKQNFLAEQFRAHEAARVIITIGAAFDFAAGVKRRAPRWMQRMGLEWLFRMFQEPGRLGRRYLIGNSRFVIDAARATWQVRAPRTLTRRPRVRVR